jgi:hypothetical protein
MNIITKRIILIASPTERPPKKKNNRYTITIDIINQRRLFTILDFLIRKKQIIKIIPITIK